LNKGVNLKVQGDMRLGITFMKESNYLFDRKRGKKIH